MEPLAHASVGLMAKPLAPKAPLWALIAATQVPDLLSFGFIAIGLETPGVSTMDFNQGLRFSIPPYYPWSHGLFMCLAWSVVVAGISFCFCRDRRTSLFIGAMVLSHWVLDFLVYFTLPLFFDHAQMVGLGLLRTRPGIVLSVILEIGLIIGGVTIYFVTRKRTAISTQE